MKHSGVVMAVLLSGAGFGATAQPVSVFTAPVERVIVTAPTWLGDKPKVVLNNFVRAYSMAAPVSEEVTRWRVGICPLTHGLSNPEYNAFVSTRIREIAGQIEAPAQPPSCRTNLEIIFTAKPQDFLDRVKKDGAELLGPIPSHAESEGTMRSAVQAWYVTATRDIYGQLLTDDEDSFDLDGLLDKPVRQVTGSLLRTGLSSELQHILIIADTSKTGTMPLGAVADYIAVLALSQTQSFDACKPIPSITNLISPGCADDVKPTAMTDTDLAYLKAVYSMDPGDNLRAQQSYIADEIGKSLGLK